MFKMRLSYHIQSQSEHNHEVLLFKPWRNRNISHRARYKRVESDADGKWPLDGRGKFKTDGQGGANSRAETDRTWRQINPYKNGSVAIVM